MNDDRQSVNEPAAMNSTFQGETETENNEDAQNMHDLNCSEFIDEQVLQILQNYDSEMADQFYDSVMHEFDVV